MKGTLISFDFVEDVQGNIKFLEMNTDTTIAQVELDNEISWDGLFGVMTGSSATELDVIYKPKIHQHIVNHLSASVVANAPFITAFRHHEEDFYNIFPTSVTDSADKFILRLAYDDNAIVDNTYCAQGYAPLQLLNEYNSSSLAVPFYVSGSNDGVFDGEYNTLVTSSNSANIPDLAIKTKRDSVQGLKFVKVQDWATVKDNYKAGYYLTNYLLPSASEDTDNVVSSFRHYSIAYGGGLEPIELGTYKQYAQFSLPLAAALAYSGSSNEVLHNKHYYEFSTSVPKTRYAYEGVYFTDKFVSSSNEPLGQNEIQVGTELKAYHFAGAPDTDDPKQYLDWSHPGKAIPADSGVTGSIATALPRVAQDRLGNVFALKPSGSSTPVYFGIQTSLITYNTGSDSWAYRGVQTINKDKDFVFNQAGELVPIEEMDFVIMNDATGSFYSVDIENTDNLVVDTDGEENIVLGFHNPPVKIEPPK
jgi:hypothetical protein